MHHNLAAAIVAATCTSAAAMPIADSCVLQLGFGTERVEFDPGEHAAFGMLQPTGHVEIEGTAPEPDYPGLELAGLAGVSLVSLAALIAWPRLTRRGRRHRRKGSGYLGPAWQRECYVRRHAEPQVPSWQQPL